jgi:hypothetical protein
MNVGVFDYAVTLVSATGETTPGPISTQVATGGPAAAPPQSAPALSGPIAGGSVTPGAHQYGVTFTGPYGETGIGPASQAIVAQGPMGAPPPPTGTFDKGGQELGPGTTYQYQTTYVTATGETTASGSSAPVTIDPVPNGGSPPVAPTPTVATGGAIPTGYFYEYAVSFLTAKGETDFVWNLTMTARLDPPNNAFLVTQLPTSSDPRVIGRKLYRRNASLGTGGLVATINDNSTTQYTDTAAAVGGLPAGNTTAWGRVVLSNIYPGGPATTARRIYRTQPGQPPGTFYLLATINNNTATSYTDTTPNVSAGQNPPGTDTTGARTIQVSGIATGPAGTTGRNLYRTPANSSTLKLLGTIANNSTTSLTDTLDDSALGATAPSGATLNTVNLSGIALGGPMVLQRKLYRRFNGAGPFKLVTTIGNNTSTTYQDTASNAALGAAAPTTNTAAAGQVAVSQIPIGGAGVTGRKLYRTAVGSQQLRFVATLGDNVASTYTDVTSDFNLGANAPVNDTSGLQQPDGQVSAGATSLIVAGISAFSATGGWAILGNGQQIIRYTGVSATSLTGIPASGTGSLKATVSYNANITAAPALTGVSGLAMTLAPNLGLLKGDPIAIWIQRDDVAAQNELAAREGGGDGIIEHRIVDQRRGEPSLQALCDADLAQYARSLVTVTYACRDVKTKSGKPIVIDIPSPLIQETLTIQDVVITELDIVPGLQPKFAVTASSIRFTLEDLLRRMASTLEGI